MLSVNIRNRFLNVLEDYRKSYLGQEYTIDGKSCTRLLINRFLSDVLGYKPAEEIKPVNLLQGPYPCYAIQIFGICQFLVVVKAPALRLTKKQEQQIIHYCSVEKTQWVLLTNGGKFDFYKITAVELKKVFNIHITKTSRLNELARPLQYLHKSAIRNKSLWLTGNKYNALNPGTIRKFLYNSEVLTFITFLINRRYGVKCTEDEIVKSMNSLMRKKKEFTRA